MNWRATGAIALLITCSGCGSTTAPLVGSSTTSTAVVVITVVNAANTAMPIPEVEVSVITSNGAVRVIGETDEFGQIAIVKDEFAKASAVLFCHRLFFCGAIRPHQSRLVEYGEYLITIAPVTVR